MSMVAVFSKSDEDYEVESDYQFTGTRERYIFIWHYGMNYNRYARYDEQELAMYRFTVK